MHRTGVYGFKASINLNLLRHGQRLEFFTERLLYLRIEIKLKKKKKYIYIYIKSKIHPKTGHEGPQGS